MNKSYILTRDNDRCMALSNSSRNHGNKQKIVILLHQLVILLNTIIDLRLFITKHVNQGINDCLLFNNLITSRLLSFGRVVIDHELLDNVYLFFPRSLFASLSKIIRLINRLPLLGLFAR